MDQSHPRLAEGTGGGSAALGGRGVGGGVDLVVFLFFGFPTVQLDTSLKSKTGGGQTKRGVRGGPPKGSEHGPVITRGVNQPPGNP